MRYAGGLALLLLFLPLTQGKTQHIVVPVQVQIPLLLKVISLEKNFSSYGDIYTIGVLFQDSFERSRALKDDILPMNGMKHIALLNGTPVDFVPLEIRSEEDIEKQLSAKNIKAVYITPLRSIDITVVSKLTKRLKIISLTGVPEYVEAGISVGVGIEGEKSKVLINLASSKEEGADFSSKVLSIARIIH